MIRIFTKTFFRFFGSFIAILLLSFLLIAALSWWGRENAKVNHVKEKASVWLSELF